MAESGASGVDPVDGGTLLPPNAPADLHSAMASLAAAGCGGSADTNALMDTSHVQQLINHGADVNASDNNGWTPLHTAAYHGQEEIVRILLAANSDVNARNKSEETPLHLAAKWPQDRVVEALLAGGADLSARNKRGRTPAHVAALFNRHAILDRLLNAGADVNAADADHATPLHLAVRQGSPVEPELVKTLIRHRADLEARDVKGNAPLHFLPYAQEWLHWAAYEGQEALVRVLLGKPGVRPDAVGEEGVTPLHLAAHANSVSMVTLLLEAGAKVNATSQPPSRPSGKDSSYLVGLPGVPSSITSGVSISSSLRVYGAAKLPPGELTALHVAAERGSAELIRVLVAAGAKVNVQGERGMAPLHVAVWDGNTAAVASLLAAKASVALKSKAGGFTAVHCACLSARATPELLALLLDNGGAAVIEERCQEGWTALHLACQSAPPAMVELLLQRGARPSAKGKNGKTAADCAAKRPEILQVLHVATGGKVPLPVGLALPAAAAAAGLLTNGAAGKAGGGTGQLTAGRGSGKTSSSGRGGPAGRQLTGGSSSTGAGPSTGSASSASASGSGSAASPSTSTALTTTSPSAAGSSASSAAAINSSSSSSALLPGTAAVLEPLESVEATLAALLADMGGALCSLQAGAIFGSGACTVDPVGHCIRPLDKRLVMVCTMGCQFAFHLPCWKAARELLKERWPGFTGSLQAGSQYACIAPGCSGYVREQAICDGAHGQASNPSRLYWMPREQYDELPSTAKPIGGGPPPLPGGGEGCLGVGGSVQQPAQPAIPAGLTPSLSLAQAMVQAATALGNVVGGRSGLAGSPLAVALAAGGGLQQLLGASSPPVPAVMSAREAAAIAAQTMGACLGGSGGGGGGSSSCVVEELSEEDEEDEIVFMYGGENGSGGGARAGGSTAGAGSGKAAASSSTSGASAAVAASNGPSSKRHGGSGSGSGSGGSSAPPVAKKGGKVASKGSKGSSAISSAAAAEMLQQLQGLQQAVAAVQNAVGAGVSSAGEGVGAGSGAGGGTGSSSGTAAAAPDQGSAAPAGGAAPSAGDTSTNAAAGSAGSKAPAPSPPPPAPVAELPPPPAAVLPPPPTPLVPLLPADGAAADSGGDGGYSLQEPAAPVPPPRRRSTPPHIARHPPPPLSESGRLGQPPVSPQLATPPPATSLHTPGVQPRLSPKRGSAGGSGARQPEALLTPILVGPVETPAPAAAPAAAPVQSEPVSTTTTTDPAAAAEKHEQKQLLEPLTEEDSPPARPASPPGKAGAFGSPVAAAVVASKADVQQQHADAPQGPALAIPELVLSLDSPTAPAAAAAAAVASPAAVETPAAVGVASPPPLAPSGRDVPAGCVAEVVAAAGAGAAAGKASASVTAAPSGGLTVTRAVMVSQKLSAAQAAVAFGTTQSYEPGQYARMVCPDLQPGQHRVTRSAGSGPAEGSDGGGSGGGAPAATARPSAATATQGTSAGGATASVTSYDVVLNALRGLVAGDGTASAAAAATPLASADVAESGAGGTPAASRHLLLESGDIPLLAGTPGMLEAWLSAHVGSHGKLASYRILAPCGAVAVTLESEAAAEAAAEALRARDKLLVQPLAVGPLRAFPEDDVLAATVQKVAKSRSPAGDTTWMSDMVQLWQQLQGLPPAVHYTGA